MKKIIMLGILTAPYFLYAMDVLKDRQIVPKNGYFRPINPEVAERHNAKEWHKKLTHAVIFDQENAVNALLKESGRDSIELVCTAYSTYGPILRATYIENKPQMRALLKKHMDQEYFKQCFNLEKSRLHDIWRLQLYTDSISPAAEHLVRDFYQQDPIKYSLSAEECEKLGIKKITMPIR